MNITLMYELLAHRIESNIKNKLGRIRILMRPRL